LGSIPDPVVRALCASLIQQAQYYLWDAVIPIMEGFAGYAPGEVPHQALWHGPDNLLPGFPGVVHVDSTTLDLADQAIGEWHLASVVLHEMIHTLGYPAHPSPQQGQPHQLGGSGPYRSFWIYDQYPYSLLNPSSGTSGSPPSCMLPPP
jgi:hypothetical protein